MTESSEIPFHGARANEDGSTTFSVWAPEVERIDLRIVRPDARVQRLARGKEGYHVATVDGVGPGAAYFYRFADGRERPDPASRFQPEGVHGASVVVSRDFTWSNDDFRGTKLDDYVVYELHVGTFTEEGTFDAIVAHLDRLRDLGITAIEVMPVSQFPGARNWGYDGVYPHAVQASYGGPEAFKRFIDECHARRLAVVLDVVYNHLGPEGNYLGEFASYFTDRYKTAWGLAINFDGPGSDHVRGYFIQSALQWIEEYRVDGLRIDAVHAIVDTTATPFLAQIAEVLHQRAGELGRELVLIAESDLNDPRMIRPAAEGGYGYDAQWADDLHHALHAVLTGEERGYYSDYRSVEDIALIYETGWLYTGQYSAYRQRSYGASPKGLSGSKFIVCLQNHDQIGNRMMGDRLAAKLSFDQLKTALGLVLTSPFTPMLFMGEEYGETRPFMYFTSHGDRDLVEAVRKGRGEEFAAFGWEGSLPDPDALSTFDGSRLDHVGAASNGGEKLQAFVRKMLSLRRRHPALRSHNLERSRATGDAQRNVLTVIRGGEGQEVFIAANFSDRTDVVAAPGPKGVWGKLISSSDPEWGGSEAAPHSVDFDFLLPAHTLCVYERPKQE